MIVKTPSDVSPAPVPGFEHISKRIILGPKDGSEEIILRYFSVAPDGATPHHSHGFPHLVRVESGQGVIIDPNGTEHPLKSGDFVYVPDDEIHQFRNTGELPFDFVCIVPERGEIK